MTAGLRDPAGPILLLGAAGQIGWELARTLAPLGPVVALSRAEIDLASAEAIRDRVRTTAPGLIVNAAAYTAVDRAEREPDLATAVNGTAPGVLAEEAKRLRVPLVHYSTDYVFDGRPPAGADGAARPYVESDPAAPINVYGLSKLAGEQAIRAVAPIHLILRTSWIYAARGRNFLDTMRRLAAERDEVRVVADQTGGPTWARMVAEATAQILAATWGAAGPDGLADRGGTYHLSASGATSWHGFAAAIFAAMAASGARVPRLTAITTADYPTPAARPAYSVLDGSALACAFGLALPPWPDQLALCLADHPSVGS